MKQLIVFDLDGTLAVSKSNLDAEMAELLCRLLDLARVGVISGGSFTQFQKQFLAHLACGAEKLSRLLLAPLSGAELYQYRNGTWNVVHRESLTDGEKKKILDAFGVALSHAGIPETHEENGEARGPHGVLLEDRGSQITFSGLGSAASIAEKDAWDSHRKKREAIAKYLAQELPEFDVRLGGMTSIDVTRKGIDKAFGLSKMAGILNIPFSGIQYVGDAMYIEGNDHIIFHTDISAIAVRNPAETKAYIKDLLARSAQKK